MKMLLFVMAVVYLSVVDAQDNRTLSFPGNWKAVGNDSELKNGFSLSFDSDSVELRFDSVSRRTNYVLDWRKDTCEVTLVSAGVAHGRFLIVPISQNEFDLNTIESDEQLSKTRKQEPGSIAWGWHDPRPIRFVRQQSVPAAQRSVADKLKISPLTGNFFIYTTYSTYQGSQTPAHGMFVDTEDGVVLLDTPWDTTQFQPLLDSIRSRTGKAVRICIATHWHGDRTAGLAYYRARGIRTYTTTLTDQLSLQHGQKRAEFLLNQDSLFRVGSYAFETCYPGPGHTKDNIVVWFPKEQILYGGCLIKGAEAENLGYLGDADVSAYESTLIRVREKYPRPKYIIVSHHDWHSLISLEHSIKLAGALKKQ